MKINEVVTKAFGTKLFKARVRINQGSYKQLIDTTVVAKNLQMAIKLLKAQYGKDSVVGNPKIIQDLTEGSETTMRAKDFIQEGCEHGRYYCSTDKKWKCRQGPKQTRKTESVEQGVAEGSDDIEDTRQWRDAIALAKSQKAIRQTRYGKDQKFYADGTPVTPEEVARRAAERKAKKQGVAEGFNGISVDIEPELDYDVVYVDINGKKYNFNYWYSDEKPTNELEFRRDIPEYLKREEWYNKLDFPTKMEVLHAVVQAELGNEPSEYKPTVGDEPLDEEKQRLDPKCWTGYKKQGTKMKGGVRVNNCVKISESEYTLEGEVSMWYDDQLNEAEYQGRKVPLGKPMQGDVKKFKVYVKNEKGNVVKVNFGDPNMRIKKSNPARRKSFRARHNCDNPGPRTKARYWSCRKW